MAQDFRALVETFHMSRVPIKVLPRHMYYGRLGSPGFTSVCLLTLYLAVMRRGGWYKVGIQLLLPVVPLSIS